MFIYNKIFKSKIVLNSKGQVKYNPFKILFPSIRLTVSGNNVFLRNLTKLHKEFRRFQVSELSCMINNKEHFFFTLGINGSLLFS